MSKTIETSCGKTILVDDCDFDALSSRSWYYSVRGYATASIQGKHKSLHRFLLNPPNGVHIDHINGNRLDNRRSNLRTCNNAENCRNSVKKPGSNKFKGVYFEKNSKRKNKYQASIVVDYKKIHLGRWPTEAEAAKAYNFWAAHYHGEFARFNEVP